MSYRALLFCPDEKAARTVTQVLGELEFTVEPCVEPFAAVKKLMGEHFDAVVVDCDNEQNATLLFKSARNSTSNQASLAVAVVEGQAGVAKAFRIGANLVLTKPINIEQSKGTLRVARGLLRKGEPVKPGTPVPVPPAPATAALKPAAPKPVAPLKSAAPTAPAMAATPRPTFPPVKPEPKPAPAPTVHSVPLNVPAAHAPTAQSGNLPSISLEDSVAPAAPKVPAFTAAPTFSSGAASAPAPAREVPEAHVAEIAASPAKEAEPLVPQQAEQHEPSLHSAAPTAFTFGGTNVPEKSGDGNKKILLAVAAVVLVAAAAYGGWTYFQGRSTPSGSFESRISGPVATPPTAKPTSSAASSAVPTPVTTSAPQTAPATTPEAAAPRTAPETKDITLSTNEPSEYETPAKPSTTASSKSAPAKSGGSPLIVKGGDIPAVHTKPSTADTPAPSMIGLATPGSSAPPLNLVGSGSEPKPLLQTLHISQGVSQGLLIKKVQPVYPRNALTMHMEGAVELTATVSKSGAITAVKVVSGEQILTKAAVDAVKQWKYKPYLLNGEPVEIQTQVTINFKLPN
jgi:protein TonB